MYKRRKIDPNSNGEEVYMHAEPPGSSHDVLARPPPLTAHRSRLAPPSASASTSLQPRHRPGTCPASTNPPSASTPRCTSPTRPRATRRTMSVTTGSCSPSPTPRTHKPGRDHGHGYTLPPFKFSHPHSHPHPHSPVDINGHAHPHEHDTHEHDSWRPYAESELGRARVRRGRRLACLSLLSSFLWVLDLLRVRFVCGRVGLCSPSDARSEDVDARVFPLLTTEPLLLFNSGAGVAVRETKSRARFACFSPPHARDSRGCGTSKAR
ncbi:hypothetical protein B0H13DRAFT_2680411 [Mycena leptocephala]|nr:hypothetical protein B0H13DRAFT_2680411 [Mycena leptocephala]